MESLYIGRGKDEDNAKLLAFLDQVFFVDEGEDTRFLELLPKIYKDQYRPAYNNFVVQQPDGTFRAAVGNFDNDMTVGGVDLKTCCIGNVAVGKDQRGRGYMIDLMNASVTDMIERGVALSYLGGQRQRYGYFGYENAGTCYSFGFSKSSLRHAVGGIESGLTVEPLRPDDTEAIRLIDEIYTKAPVISRRSPAAYYDILCSWHDRPYLIKEDGRFVGYAVFNKNMDYVGEFGLTDAALLPRLIAAALETGGRDSVCCAVAPYETEKLDFFTKNASWMNVNHCESVLVLDWKTVLTAYLNAKAAYETLCDGELTVLIHGKAGDETLKLGVKDNAVSVTESDGAPRFELDCLAAVRAFFSNYPADRAAFPPEIRQWLPLPMFFSSRDTM
ncbi:MAG: GNAT family N-acetyltransferase [Clostridia bacterium]|nr:GNAT family N-acetyltransferase [Clostridia bacterium]